MVRSAGPWGSSPMRPRLLVRFSPPNRRAGCLAVAYRSSPARSSREIVPPNPSLVVILSMAGGRLAAAFILPIGLWRGALVPGQSPPAGLQVAVLPREEVTVHDNWQVAGLRGTGSCDFSIDNVFVPDNMTFSLMDAIHGNVVTGEKVMFRLGFPAFFTAFHVGVPLGIARRALDEITAQAISKSRGITATTPLAAQPQFQ